MGSRGGDREDRRNICSSALLMPFLGGAEVGWDEREGRAHRAVTFLSKIGLGWPGNLKEGG